MSFDIPVEKKVELLGKSAPLTDTDFNFAFTLANDAGKTDMLKLYFDGKPVTDSFTMTVKAGETSAAGVLTVSGLSVRCTVCTVHSVKRHLRIPGTGSMTAANTASA